MTADGGSRSGNASTSEVLLRVKRSANDALYFSREGSGENLFLLRVPNTGGVDLFSLDIMWGCTPRTHTHPPLNEQRYTFVVAHHLQSNPTVSCMIFDQFQHLWGIELFMI